MPAPQNDRYEPLPGLLSLPSFLYGKLGLSPGKKTPKGQLSTDASVLEKLRDQHPIVDALLSTVGLREPDPPSCE